MKMTVGILAHVDAGKTTFSEQVLYQSRAIRSLGRVDHQDAFLDAHPIERQRGITIFSGQACLQWGPHTVYWLDTPGHVDFSAEMERAVSMMDYAILIVSCVDGVQSHTETVWHLLDRYQVPVFLFLNKTDREGADPDAALQELRQRLSADVIDLRAYQRTGVMDEALQEAVAERDEALLDRWFSGSYDADAWQQGLMQQIRERRCFPMMCGAALTGQGVDSFTARFQQLAVTDYDQRIHEPLQAQVYRVRHDAQGGRVCFMKLLRGMLHVKDELPLPSGTCKVNELRVYHGEKYRTLDTAQAGDIVAIPGLDELRPGDRIGEGERRHFHTEPMMAADLLWDAAQIPVFKMSQAVRILEDEEPSLAVEQTGDRISLHVMGAIQLEILTQLMQDRFGYPVQFGPCRVLYRETIAEPVIGIGHYEPLRHYAEVLLRLVPGENGSGIRFRSRCHVDTLSLNWQRLIETHVFEKQHKGVLTGSPLTDVTIELLTGRDHLKHTEGGDFRQSTYRAIRNALMYAKSVLLEPICGFEIRTPADQYGSMAGALSRMQAETETPIYAGESVILRGEAPFALFSAWQTDFMMMTHGRGSLRVWMARYAPCRDAEAVIAAADYLPLADDTPDSVFCSHGAGFTVAWDHVKDFAHCTWEEK